MTQPAASDERLVVDRKSKSYAFFVGDEQQGNWMTYVDDAEPERIAVEYDVPLESR